MQSPRHSALYSTLRAAKKDTRHTHTENALQEKIPIVIRRSVRGWNTWILIEAAAYNVHAQRPIWWLVANRDLWSNADSVRRVCNASASVDLACCKRADSPSRCHRHRAFALPGTPPPSPPRYTTVAAICLRLRLVLRLIWLYRARVQICSNLMNW